MRLLFCVLILLVPSMAVAIPPAHHVRGAQDFTDLMWSQFKSQQNGAQGLTPTQIKQKFGDQRILKNQKAFKQWQYEEKRNRLQGSQNWKKIK